MDIQKFQQKLTEACELGEKNGKVLKPAQIKECFGELDLDKSQLIKILQYLKLKGITIEGAEVLAAAPQEEHEEESAQSEEKVPLTPEEEVYLKEYLVGIVIINRPEMFWQLRHQGDLSPYNIYGGMDEAKKLGCETPDPAPLMEFILREYGARLKPYSVLASCPKNASDEIWRCWAEKRFAFLVEENQVRA